MLTRAGDLDEPLVRDRRGRPRPPRTSFIGREAEVASLAELLRSPDVRLITITGRSGSGRTRLATEVARRLGRERVVGDLLLAVVAD